MMRHFASATTYIVGYTHEPADYLLLVCTLHGRSGVITDTSKGSDILRWYVQQQQSSYSTCWSRQLRYTRPVVVSVCALWVPNVQQHVVGGGVFLLSDKNAYDAGTHTHLSGFIPIASRDSGSVGHVPRKGEVVQRHAHRRRLFLVSELLAKSAKPAVAFIHRRCRRAAQRSGAAAADLLLQKSAPLPARAACAADGNRRHSQQEAYRSLALRIACEL